jgi:hypothetical protein
VFDESVEKMNYLSATAESNSNRVLTAESLAFWLAFLSASFLVFQKEPERAKAPAPFPDGHRPRCEIQHIRTECRQADEACFGFPSIAGISRSNVRLVPVKGARLRVSAFVGFSISNGTRLR